jgi:flagellar biosynthetic protein FliR
MSPNALDAALLDLAATHLLASVRLLGLFLSLPLLSFRALPLSLRVGPVLILALVAAPPSGAPVNADLLCVGSELAIGLVMGWSLRLAMLAVDLTTEALSMHSGFSFAQTVSPQAALPSTALGEFLGMGLLATLFVSDLHLIFIERLATSMSYVPLGTWPSGWKLQGLVTLITSAFSMGLVLSCGSFALYLFSNTMLGLIGRISPQLNLMAVGFSINAPLAALVMLMLVLQLPALSDAIATAALAFVGQGLGPGPP